MIETSKVHLQNVLAPMSAVCSYLSFFFVVGVSLLILVSVTIAWILTLVSINEKHEKNSNKNYNFLKKIAIKNGDLDRLLVPTDSSGRKCGVDNSVNKKPYLLFFNLERCIDARVPLFGCKTPQVCVENCPTTTFIYSEYECNNNKFYEMRENLICQMGVDKLNDIKSCDNIKYRIDRGDCARWYLPSNSCK